jgi:hypothetical protein
MKAQVIERNGRPEWAVIPWAEYERLLELATERADIALAEAAAEAIAAGEALIPGDVVKRLVAGEPPLKIWREYRGLDRAALGAAAAVAEDLIQRWEEGRAAIDGDALARLAAALDVDVDDLSPPCQLPRSSEALPQTHEPD